MTDKKLLIYETAKKLFIEKGYDNVTINDICSSCGITKSNFYYHIQSKDEIIVYYYDKATQNTRDIIANLFTETDSWNQILILFHGLLDNLKDLGVEFNKQALSISIKENLRTFDLREDINKIGTSIIKKGQEEGKFKNKDNPESLFVASCYMFSGYELMRCIKNGNYDWKNEFTKSLASLLGLKN